ncbi:PH domain-containing protein [Microbacterium sp. Gd 4-13]|uniref:PH domain-containing protein n=1 Tax=Microbacterium sp. Gd 4-13 TaxID=2173179 RepID=UPI001F0C036A|nr:PH domain-containing protein [Microbacterium sp. Gd 4-13]
MSEASAPSAPPADEVRSPLSDGEWHRMHPLTPLLRGGLFLLVVGGIAIANLRERLVEWLLPAFAPEFGDGELPPDPIDYLVSRNLLLIALLAVLGTVVVLLLLFSLSWRFHTFRITDDDVEVRSGVLFRTHRRAPLDRVQGVNLTRPLVARLLGVGKLEVVGAGTDSNVKLEYLSTSDAETIRADILRLASGRRLGGSAAARSGGTRVRQAASAVGAGLSGLVDGDDQGDVEPESVVHIPAGRLIASRLLSGTTLVLIALIAAIVVGSIVGSIWVLFSFVPAVLGFGAYYVRSVTRALRYSIAPMPSGTRITFGLFTTVSETLPPGRVHAVEVRQSIFWRPFGWWSITANRLSGRSSSDTNADQFTTVLPVGTRADVERVLKLLLPALPDEDWPFVFDQGILGPRADDPYATTPARARLLRPLSWRRNGYLLTPDALFLRRGFVWRALGVFPLARMQSVGIAQGPVDRMLGVANLTAHVVAGSVTTTVGILERDDALRGFQDAAHGIVAASAGDRSHRWASSEPDQTPAGEPVVEPGAAPADPAAPASDPAAPVADPVEAPDRTPR